MTGQRGDLVLPMLNGLDASSHPALRDRMAGDRLEGMTPEWHRRSAQALAFCWWAGRAPSMTIGTPPLPNDRVPAGFARHVHPGGSLDRAYAQQHCEPGIGGTVVHSG